MRQKLAANCSDHGRVSVPEPCNLQTAFWRSASLHDLHESMIDDSLLSAAVSNLRSLVHDQSYAFSVRIGLAASTGVCIGDEGGAYCARTLLCEHRLVIYELGVLNRLHNQFLQVQPSISRRS